MTSEPKTIWIVRDLEPIPTDPENRRLMRTGMLATTLARMGHHTRWITSSFDHYRKNQRMPGRQDIAAEANLTVTVLPAPGYRRNVSLARIRHNRVFARAFSEYAKQSTERPDVIVTDVPTTEAAERAVSFGRSQAIPTIVSIRDLWPDFFTNIVPPPMRLMIRPLLYPLDRQVQFACAQATSLVGISQGYLDWGLRKAGRSQRSTDRIVPLGYAPVPLPATSRRVDLLTSLGILKHTRLVTFIGSWGHTYNLDLLYETATNLQNDQNIAFLIAGQGDQSDRLLPKFAQLKNVILPGWVDAEQIAIILDRSEIGLLPYKPDAPQGLPNKVFEYMAYGAYQISSIKGELATFFEDNQAGKALATTDSAVFAAAIRSALDDGDIAGHRQARISRFLARYAASSIYRDFAEHILAISLKNRKFRLTSLDAPSLEP